MNRDLHWTTDLGNAYYNQPQDVLQTIQVMRQRAEDAGNTAEYAAEGGHQQGYIQVAPMNPAVVYVPSYNPWDVYGQPVASLSRVLADWGAGVVCRVVAGAVSGWGWQCRHSATRHLAGRDGR